MSFFISNALAQTTTATAPAQTGSALPSILMLVGFIVIFYLLLWRPQAKRNKEHRDLISNLSVGDEVLTAGGIYGKISRMADDYVMIEIADNTQIKLQKNSIANVLPKGTLKSN